MTEKRHAAGGIVMKKYAGKARVLLIKDSYGHWTWPKGHLEKGESPEDGALREIAEETAQTKLKMIAKLGVQEYFFETKNSRIHKIVHIFLFSAASLERVVPQLSEIKAAKWFPAEEALDKVDYKGARSFVMAGIKKFKKEK